MTTMSSPKPQASLSTPSSPEELTVVQLDSSRSAEPTPGSSRDMPEQPSSSGSSARRINLYADEIRSQWNIYMIFSTHGTHEQCIAFADQRGLLPTAKMCTYHKQPIKLSETTSHGQVGKFSCRKGKCRTKSYSRALGTWFENSRLPLPLIFQLTYLFSENYTYELARKETRHWRETVVSQATIADWYSYCREAIVVYYLENEESLQKIGGPGKIVQVDESKFGRRKYNRGRNVEGHWVLGLIEDGSDDFRLEVCPGNERNAEVLVGLIKKHVQEGTTIHTDFWKGYDCLPEHGYIHKKVNHSDPVNKFVAPDGVHTQRIESHWRVMNRLYAKENYKGNFTEWLIEVMWRRKIKINHLDPFEELIKCIKYIYK